MWGVFDFVCLDFFVAFFISARAPSSLRSTSEPRLPSVALQRTENFSNRNEDDGRLFSCVITVFARVNSNFLAFVASSLLSLSCVSAFALL